jgi:hypothetical protein
MFAFNPWMLLVPLTLINRKSSMNANTDPSTFTVSLALTAHLQAEKFRCYQSNPHKAKQVYLNTLAVYATNYYLQCLGFKTDLEASDSWNPAMQTLMDVADLAIQDCGKLECRSVLPEAEDVSIPAEVWSDRIGYVAVQFDESLRQATLLGFIEQVSTSKLLLNQLRSLEALPRYLNQLRHPKPVVKLTQWLENVFEVGWQVANEIFVSPQPALNFRGGDSQSISTGDCLRMTQAENPLPLVSRSKLLELEPTGEQVFLMVGLMPTGEQEMEIWVKLYPTGSQTHLPPNLQLIVLDEAGETVMAATARSTESILLKFSGEVGEHFSLKIALDDLSLREVFVI